MIIDGLYGFRCCFQSNVNLWRTLIKPHRAMLLHRVDTEHNYPVTTFVCHLIYRHAMWCQKWMMVLQLKHLLKPCRPGFHLLQLHLSSCANQQIVKSVFALACRLNAQLNTGRSFFSLCDFVWPFKMFVWHECFHALYDCCCVAFVLISDNLFTLKKQLKSVFISKVLIN